MIDGLTGEAGQALSEALGTPDEGPLMLATFGGFGPEGEALAARMADFTGPEATAETAAAFLPYLDELDALTFERCGVPAGMAYSATNASLAVVRFSCVGQALTGDEQAAGVEPAPCSEPSAVFPTSLPCFERVGETWVGMTGVDSWPWVSVDCESGEPVRWDHEASAWVEGAVSAQDAFEAIAEAIGE